MVHLDPATGRVVEVEDALRQSGAERFYNGLWPVHASRVGGVIWKLATALGGLALFALSLYGAESYRRKLFGTRRKLTRAAA
jgi:uncharacterized iron-regulated membrane protein